jgi:hypothetical protein
VTPRWPRLVGDDFAIAITSPTAGSRSPCATIPVQMAWQHISDEDLERYHLGMVTDESELAPLEEHLLACSSCAERAEEAIRAAIIEGGYDLT